MADEQTVPVFAPDGTLGDIPQSQLVAAVKAGAKPGVHITAPDGSPGIIPADRTADAVKAGGKIVPFSDQPVQHPGFWFQLGQDLKGMLQSGGGTVGAFPEMALPVQPHQMQQATEQLAQSDAARKTAGRSGPYRAGATVAQAVGVNVPGMEQSAEEGDIAGVAGHAAAVPTVMAATEGVRLGGGLLAKKTVGSISKLLPSAERAGQAFNEVRSTAGELPIDVSKAGDVALDLKDFASRGGRLPKVINDFVRRATTPNSPPITFSEARDFYSNANSLSVEEANALKPAVKRQVVDFVHALGDSLKDTADQAGVGQQYRGAMKEYASAAQMRELAANLKSWGWKTAAAGAIAAGGGYGAKAGISLYRQLHPE